MSAHTTTVLLAALLCTTVEGEPPKDVLTAEQEEAIAEELAEELKLAPIDDPHYIESMWELSRRLTFKHAYCRATRQLEIIEETEGTITDNRAFAAQAFYMCARTRLTQGHIAEAGMKLQRAKNIVPERPEYRDLEFKLAIVRAKEAIDLGDLDGVKRNMEEAHTLGVELGPGGGDRLADWAVPIIYDTANIIATWSYDLLEAGNRELADQVAGVALQYHPNNRTAGTVQRDILFFTVVLPAVLVAVGVFAIAAIAWGIIRRQRVRGLGMQLDEDDDELEDDELLD